MFLSNVKIRVHIYKIHYLLPLIQDTQYLWSCLVGFQTALVIHADTLAATTLARVQTVCYYHYISVPLLTDQSLHILMNMYLSTCKHFNIHVKQLQISNRYIRVRDNIFPISIFLLILKHISILCGIFLLLLPYFIRLSICVTNTHSLFLVGRVVCVEYRSFEGDGHGACVYVCVCFLKCVWPLNYRHNDVVWSYEWLCAA